MFVIRYRLKLTEPVLAAATGGDTNARSGFPYIPGNLIRGVLIGKYRQADSERDFDPADEAVRRLFFDGRTRYLNAYPWNETKDQRALPVPRSWFREKHRSDKAFDLALDPQEELTGLRSLGQPFWIWDKDQDKALLLTPRQRLSVHTQRERWAGRATEKEGAVYRYDALDDGQWFEGLILGESPADADMLKNLLPGPARLGTARTAGYGGAEISVVKVENNANWRETGGSLSKQKKLTALLLSEVLLRDDHGHPSADPGGFTAALSRKLGNATLRLQQAFVASRPVSGFNRAWNLPLPQQPALAMGSILVYDWPEHLTDTKPLQALEWSGLGERRAEGFGRIAVNWPGPDQDTWDLGEATADLGISSVRPALGALDGDAASLARRMAERLLRRDLDRHLIKRAGYWEITKPPTKAQLGRLRMAIRGELMRGVPDPAEVIKLIESIEKRHRVKAGYARSRVRGQTLLLEWLKNELAPEAENERWDRLIEFPERDCPKVAGIAADLSVALRREYLLRLLDAVLARAQKAPASQGNPEREVHHG